MYHILILKFSCDIFIAVHVLARLAAASEKRVQLDQQKVENTLSRNRQSEVERYYQEFYDGKRVDALEKLEQEQYINSRCRTSFTPIDKKLRRQRLACKIFEVCQSILASFPKYEESAHQLQSGYINPLSFSERVKLTPTTLTPPPTPSTL